MSTTRQPRKPELSQLINRGKKYLRADPPRPQSLLATLQSIAQTIHANDAIALKRSPLHADIVKLFVDAKKRYVNDREQLDGIRLRQAFFIERMGHYHEAHKIYVSLINHAHVPLRYEAMNMRTWLLRHEQRFEEALQCAEKLIRSYEELPAEEKPSRRRCNDTKKLRDSIRQSMKSNEPEIELNEAFSPSTNYVSLGKSSFTHFGERARNADRDEVTEQYKREDRSISPLVRELFQ